MAESVYIPDNNSGNTVPAWLAMNNGWGNGGLFGGNGGSAFWGALLGSVVPGIFGGWGNGFGGFGNNGAAAASLGAQATANSNTELLMNAITSSGEASRAAISNLATALGQDYNQMSAAVSTIQNGLNSLALSEAVSVPQIINAIQSGNTTLMSKLCECCCENRLLTTQQGYESQIRTIEQTNQLGSQADRNTASVVGAINDLKATTISEFCAARERDMQAKIDTQADIITQLRGQISNDAQTATFTAAFNVLNQKITDLAARQPNTVPVTWPALTAVNTTPYVNGGYYGNGFGFGNGVSF